jgi:spermidine/putrescine transport system permease protein
MLLVLARLQSFDRGLEEAALDLGASHSQVMRRILLPHLYPAIGAGAAIGFFQSIENFNVTLFTRGTYDTLTVYVFSKVRTGITPTINALALIMITATLLGAVGYEIPAAARTADCREIIGWTIARRCRVAGCRAAGEDVERVATSGDRDPAASSIARAVPVQS